MVRCQVGSLYDVQAAEQTAHPKSGPRRRPGITSDRCTQIGEQPYLRTVGLTYPVPKMINRDTLDEFVRLSSELNEVGGLLKAWLDEKPGQANVDVPSLMRSLNRIKGEMKDIAPQLLNERESV